MRTLWMSLIVLAATVVATIGARAETVTVTLPANAGPVERLAAAELVGYLGKLYPQMQFVAGDQRPATGKIVLLGVAGTDPLLPGLPDGSGPESFAVSVAKNGGHELASITGADPRGVVYGVYALLVKLGCGFYLSYDALPAERKEPFAFDGWQLTDKPLVGDRMVFDWHNFLSGCSTWNLADWQRWTTQSQKMGFNTIMVHAYGNNPMVSFDFNGKTKPVGYLSTTISGRDWSTMHVNDVRRLWGGEVFAQAAFGADAALVPDARRAEAARKLMREVFAHAAGRGMEVCFADDVDTASANPQELILTLPREARFPIGVQAVQWMNQEAGRMWLADPDTPEGYRYYRTQVAALLADYPQITRLVVWFRTGGTPWMELKVAEMPAAWQKEYQAEIDKTPDAGKLWHAPQVFALGKILRAFDRALKELGRERVQLAAGTWDFKFLAPCDRFFPQHVKLIGLDYNVLHGNPQLSDAESRKVIGDVAAHRAVVPVVWAQHDDGNYIGRPYTPFADFHAKLADVHAAGFGIIHWTTRPLDLYFQSLAEQVWQSGKDRPLRSTCEAMAERSFGPSARVAMGEYLERWVTDAPTFARETSDWFIDRPLTDIDKIVAGSRERQKLVDSVDATKLTPAQRDRLGYHKGLEQFIAAFFQNHDAYQRSLLLLKAGNLPAARAAMADRRPEPVIEQFAKFSALGGITRGEQGLVVSMNLRWLSHIIRQRQALGLDPVRINFAPTQHDKLAQSRGMFTFHFQADRQVWECWGQEETGATVFTLPAEAKLTRDPALPEPLEEIARTGIESDKPLTFALRPIIARDSRGYSGPASLPAGEYRLRLLLVDPVSTTKDQRVFDVAIDSGSASGNDSAHQTDRVDIFALAGQPNRIVERTYKVTVGRSGSLTLKLTPVKGAVTISGLIVESAR